MALVIDEVKIIPNPIPSSGGMVRAECHLSSSEPVDTVTAYPPEGNSVSFRKQNDQLYVATESVPAGMPPGTYDIVVVARDAAGVTARKIVAVTLQ